MHLNFYSTMFWLFSQKKRRVSSRKIVRPIFPQGSSNDSPSAYSELYEVEWNEVARALICPVCRQAGGRQGSSPLSRPSGTQWGKNEGL